MPESNLPEGTATDDAVSTMDPVKAIEDLIDLDEGPNLEEDGAEPEETEEVEAGQDDEGQDQQEQADGPQTRDEKGRFVSNDAKVTLNDGTVITVEALKRGFMSQQSFTRSTQEVAETRKALDAEKATVSQTAQALGRQRDFLLQAAQALLPQAPSRELMQADPWAFMQAKADYDEKMQLVNQILFQNQTERQRKEQAEEDEKRTRKQEQAQKLWEAEPTFRNQQAYAKFWDDATIVMAENYGFTAEELAETTDHRHYLAMRDLVKYQNALKRAKTVPKEIQQKPQLIKGGRRMDPKAKISREAQGRTAQLRKSGTFDDGVNALLDHV